MRITNKIMQNNSLYNINTNKTNEDALSTMISTGKKINRPSDDPVIAIRALRLRSNVTQLSQFYEKNSKDAESWLKVTEDALSTVSDVLTDALKQVNKGVNKDLTLDDLNTIVTQLDALSAEYYSTGNEDYAGRYIFTGYRTDTSLAYEDDASDVYTDLHDEFNAAQIDDSVRVLNQQELKPDDSASKNPTKESQIQAATVGRIRLSYDNIDAEKTSDVTLKYKEAMAVPAATTLLQGEKSTVETVNLTFTDTTGQEYAIHVPTGVGGATGNEVTAYGQTCTASYTGDAENRVYTVNVGGTSYTIDANGTVTGGAPAGTKAYASIEKTTVSKVEYTPAGGSQVTYDVPLPAPGEAPYTMKLQGGYTATVNTDGTFTINKDGVGLEPDQDEVVNLSRNGSIHSSYMETSIQPDQVLTKLSSEAEIDQAYKDLDEGKKKYVLNAATGELLISDFRPDANTPSEKEKLVGLKDITNAKTLDVVYNKSEWSKSDLRPENLFRCTKDGVIYNGGSADHIMSYDVGYNQVIEVNTTADEVFTTTVKRDVTDLKRTLDQLNSLNDVLRNLNDMKDEAEASTTLDATTKKTTMENLQTEIDATQKAYDLLREQIKDDFGHKISSMQASLDKSNVAVTENGSRSKRLSLVQNRLTNQTATFKELQSENEDTDLAEAATNFSTAQLTYQAALQATGKIMQTSLMDYI